jgi:hypothetical protein
MSIPSLYRRGKESMKVCESFLMLVICFSLPALGQDQDPHVRAEYMPKVKMTKVETDMLFVSNTPEQFMQLGFVARYPGEQLKTPPKNITLTIFSNSPKPLYENTKNQKLIAVTDGESWKAGDLTYWLGKGSRTDKGEEMFASEDRPGLGLQNPLPPNARVAQGVKIENLYLEWLLIELKPAQFAKLAKSREVELQIGQTKFQLTESQMNTIRAFATLITPQ